MKFWLFSLHINRIVSVGFFQFHMNPTKILAVFSYYWGLVFLEKYVDRYRKSLKLGFVFGHHDLLFTTVLSEQNLPLH
uniref:Uncharacterized protein n=1 Tax=Rhizophora mucronata TaxID=61149 RepID=A0A2P2PFZ2_RHIMU